MTPKALRSVRLGLGLSIPDFAARLGVTASEVAAMEKGDAMIPVRRIATALEGFAPAVPEPGEAQPVLPHGERRSKRGR